MLKHHNYHYFCVEMSFRTLKCLNIGTPKNINFPFGTNGNSMVLPTCPNILRVKGYTLCLRKKG